VIGLGNLENQGSFSHPQKDTSPSGRGTLKCSQRKGAALYLIKQRRGQTLPISLKTKTGGKKALGRSEDGKVSLRVGKKERGLSGGLEWVRLWGG